MNEKILIEKRIAGYHYRSSYRQWRFFCSKNKRPQWINPRHRIKLLAYTLNVLIDRHHPGTDFINKEKTIKALFKYLEFQDFIYGKGVDGRTVIGINRLKLFPVCERLFDDVYWLNSLSQCSFCNTVLTDRDKGAYDDNMIWCDKCKPETNE